MQIRDRGPNVLTTNFEQIYSLSITISNFFASKDRVMLLHILWVCKVDTTAVWRICFDLKAHLWIGKQNTIRNLLCKNDSIAQKEWEEKNIVEVCTNFEHVLSGTIDRKLRKKHLRSFPTLLRHPIATRGPKTTQRMVFIRKYVRKSERNYASSRTWYLSKYFLSVRWYGSIQFFSA